MSDVKDRAKIAAKEMIRTGWGRWSDAVTDLLAELERVESEKTALEQQVLHDGIAANRRIKRLVDRVNELEAENQHMKADLSGSFFVEQIRQKAAMDCVEIAAPKGSQFCVYCGEMLDAIKSHFNLEGK